MLTQFDDNILGFDEDILGFDDNNILDRLLHSAWGFPWERKSKVVSTEISSCKHHDEDDDEENHYMMIKMMTMVFKNMKMIMAEETQSSEQDWIWEFLRQRMFFRLNSRYFWWVVF